MVVIMLTASWLYVGTIPRDFSGDMLHYAGCARDGIGLYHPHHLLYIGNLRATIASLPFDPLRAACLNSVLWSLIGLAALYHINRSVSGGTALPAVSALALATAANYWRYSNSPEVYVPSVACLLCSFAAMGSSRRLVARGIAYWSRWLLAGCMLGLACLLNQAAVLAVPGVAAYGVALRKGRSALGALVSVLLAGAVSLGVYAFIYAMLHPELPRETFWTWMTRYAQVRGQTGWGDPAHVSWAGLQAALRSIRTAVLPENQHPLARKALTTAGVLLVIAAPVWASRRGKLERALLAGLGGWLLSDFLFHVWWIPTAPEQFTASSSALVCLCVVSAACVLRTVFKPHVLRSAVGVPAMLGLCAVLANGSWQGTVRDAARPPLPFRERTEHLYELTASGGRLVLPPPWSRGFAFQYGGNPLARNGYRILEDVRGAVEWLSSGRELYVHADWVVMPAYQSKRLEREPELLRLYWLALGGCKDAGGDSCTAKVDVWKVLDVPVGLVFTRSPEDPPVSLRQVLEQVVSLSTKHALGCRAARSLLRTMQDAG